MTTGGRVGIEFVINDGPSHVAPSGVGSAKSQSRN